MFNLYQIPGFKSAIEGTLAQNSMLRIHEYPPYKLFTYDKSFMSVDLVNTYGLCRSVVVNEQKRILSVAPPKSINADIFMKKYRVSDDIIAEEFVEGTMINVFYNPDIQQWEIATKNTVGGNTSFYKQYPSKTFREMFIEACCHTLLDISTLNPLLCYSFVLQHPQNRIVVPFSKPHLYLTGVFHIEKNGDVTSYDVQIYKPFFEGTGVQFPEIYPFETYESLIETYGSMNTSYDIVGVMIHNTKTGERMKIRNPVYEQVRNLRGNQPKLKYQYLSLRREGKVGEFLKYYPEHKKDFSYFRDEVHLFTNTLYENYVNCYIKKTKPLGQYPPQYKTHMFILHQQYMNNMREHRLFIKNTDVQKYVNEMHPSLLMYCLGYQMRQKQIDSIIV